MLLAVFYEDGKCGNTTALYLAGIRPNNAATGVETVRAFG